MHDVQERHLHHQGLQRVCFFTRIPRSRTALVGSRLPLLNDVKERRENEEKYKQKGTKCWTLPPFFLFFPSFFFLNLKPPIPLFSNKAIPLPLPPSPLLIHDDPYRSSHTQPQLRPHQAFLSLPSRFLSLCSLFRVSVFSGQDNDLRPFFPEIRSTILFFFKLDLPLLNCSQIDWLID